MDIEYGIHKEDYVNLNRLIDLEINKVLFQVSRRYEPHVSAHMVAVRTPEREFIRFCTDEWDDTEKDAIDCYRLRVQFVENPAYFFKANSGEPVEIETMSGSRTAIQSYDIFEFRDSEGGESVVYDAAILLVSGTGSELLIGVDNSSIAEDVYFLFSESEISEKLKEYHYVGTEKNA